MVLFAIYIDKPNSVAPVPMLPGARDIWD